MANSLNLILPWSSTRLTTNFTDAGKFAITNAKRHVPVVTLSTQDNARLLQELESGFKTTINWNKYQSDPKTYAQNRYLNYLVDSSLYYLLKIKMVEHHIQNIIFQK